MKKELLTAESLVSTEFDKANNRYYLDFEIGKKIVSIYVNCDNYESAESDEDYFVDEENLKRAVEEAAYDGQLEEEE
jgi:hypothetical protein